jgi:quinol-cytochrome oxidoreductase complex cytochrome b subunit
MSDQYDDEYDEEEEEKPPEKPKKPRKPIDWALWAMILGTIGFLVIFGAITVMAPRRPFLTIRTIGEMTQAKPTAGATAGPKPAGTAPAGAASPAAGTVPGAASTPAATPSGPPAKPK